MSLTRHLKSTHSPVRKFFGSQFPNTRLLLNDTRDRLSGVPVIDPPKGAPLGTIGHAFEFRVRIAVTGAGEEVAIPPHLAGFFELYGIDSEIDELYESAVFPSLRAELPQLLTETDSRASVDRLTRYCFALAWLEQVYRAPLASSPLLTQQPRDLDSLLEMADAEWVANVCRMMEVFHERCRDLVSAQVILDPTLEGSAEIGGADPDLIAANQLVDFKLSKSLRPIDSRGGFTSLLATHCSTMGGVTEFRVYPSTSPATACA